MKRLFICNTYYQLISALQLRLTSFKNDTVDLYLSDHSVNAYNVYNRLKELNVFNNVSFIRTWHNKLRFKDICSVFMRGFGIVGKAGFDFYDEIIFYNLGMEQLLIADFYEKHDHTTVWTKLDEGVLSYETPFVEKKYKRGKGVRAALTLRRWTGRLDVPTAVKKYYCFFPDLKETNGDWQLIAIPPITEKITELKRILNYIFDYTPERYSQKYIYFASSSDIDNNPYGETEFVFKLAEKVGRENLLVKMHPRDKRSVYKDNGISVMENSFTPWEVIQLNFPAQDKVLLTITSASFLNMSIHFNQEAVGYYLYNDIQSIDPSFLKGKEKIKNILNKLHALGMADNISEKSLQDL